MKQTAEALDRYVKAVPAEEMERPEDQTLGGSIGIEGMGHPLGQSCIVRGPGKESSWMPCPGPRPPPIRRIRLDGAGYGLSGNGGYSSGLMCRAKRYPSEARRRENVVAARPIVQSNRPRETGTSNAPTRLGLSPEPGGGESRAANCPRAVPIAVALEIASGMWQGM